ncbi:MAG: ABC transporter permease subunit [bacterium]
MLNIQISYYAKQRIIKRIIDVFMVIFLLITLFPIFWMVYSSFKDNTDILTGKIFLSKAGNNVIAIDKSPENFYIGTADGRITILDKNRNILKNRSIKSSGTSFAFDGKYAWIATSNKGLAKIRKTDLKKVASYKYPLYGIDVNKVASSVIYKKGSKIWISLESRGFEGVLEFDENTNSFLRLIDIKSDLTPFQVLTISKIDDTLLIGGDKGLISVSLATGKIVRTYPLEVSSITAKVWRIVPHDKKLYLGTSSGALDFDLRDGKILKRYSADNGIISDQVGQIKIYDDLMLFGTNQGLSMVNKRTGEIRNFGKLFPPVNNARGKGFVSGDVLSIEKDNNILMLGTTTGRISCFDIGKGTAFGGIFLKAGHSVTRWRNYVDMWYNIDFGLYMRNSLLICGISMIIAMIFATMAAYAFSRFKFPGSDIFGNLILATQMIPAIMYLIPLYIMFVKFNEVTGIPLKGTFPGIILIYSAFFIPFSIWILRGFFAAIPKELEEAARIDGCSQFQVFWHIVLPLAVPGILATGVYIFLTAWDELMFAWVLCNADTLTIPVGIRLFVGNYQNRFDLMMAAATVATLPVMVLFFMLQKYIIKGLTAGAVKG